MRALQLQLLTWGTAAAAISSAVWLSSTDQATLLCSLSYHATSPAIGLDLPLPEAPTRAGPSAGPSSNAAKAAGSTS
jgi:hypothetical protein